MSTSIAPPAASSLKQIAQSCACDRCGRNVEMTDRVWDQMMLWWVVAIYCPDCHRILLDTYYRIAHHLPPTEDDTWNVLPVV